nr:tetratricopeptide repeat protein [Solirubrobacterales bacterium]
APTRLPAFRAALGERQRLLGAAALLVVTAACAWATYQPLRAANASDAALIALESGEIDEARDLITKATDIDPVTVEPLFNLAVIEATAKRPDAARGALERAVALQPENPTTWLRLAEYDAGQGDLKGAIAALRPALYLDPKNTNAVSLFLDVTRQAATPSAPATPTP